MTADQPSCGDLIPGRSGLIEVHVRDLNQLFDSLDPSPFHEKDLDRNAEEYIVSWAKELPSRKPAALVVHLDQPVGLPGEGKILGDAVREHFRRRAQMIRRELHQLLRRGWVSLIIGLGVLAAAVTVGELIGSIRSDSPIPSVLHETLHIGGWVAMWRPLEIFLYDWWAILGDRRIYERLSRMPVRIVWVGDCPRTNSS